MKWEKKKNELFSMYSVEVSRKKTQLLYKWFIYSLFIEQVMYYQLFMQQIFIWQHYMTVLNDLTQFVN